MADLAALKELLRQGERLLDAQDSGMENALRRAVDLPRLTVASIGGTIVVGGILVAADVTIDAAGVAIFGSGILFPMAASLILARVLAGGGSGNSIALGPNLTDPIRAIDDPAIDEATLLNALLEALPGWLEINQASIRRSEQSRVRGLRTLVVGVVIIVSGLVFIVGGFILV